jgi:NAD(P)-dependent dehydrogenase (short-subunit alcohol dehydrogenase family)
VSSGGRPDQNWYGEKPAQPRIKEFRMSAQELSGSTALVTGASRGFGRGVATALAGAGANVVGVARDRAALEEARALIGAGFTPVAADAADPVVAGKLTDAYRPSVLVLAAGAAPLSRPLHRQTWETFSSNWNVDVRQTFHWLREALLRPLAPGSVVIAFSSGAALRGSPLSGGYAGAKAAIRFIGGYAADESQRAGLGIRFISVLPQLTPATELGAAAVSAYAERQGMDVAGYTESLGPALTPDQVGKAVLDLIESPAPGEGAEAYLLTAGGVRPAP